MCVAEGGGGGGGGGGDGGARGGGRLFLALIVGEFKLAPVSTKGGLI